VSNSDNSLTYNDTELITFVKSFIVLGSGLVWTNLNERDDSALKDLLFVHF
jgi:hypothetical protein